MAKFLRDEFIYDVSLTKDTLIQLSEAFAARAAPLLEIANNSGEDKKQASITFVLRFDNKGYKLFSVDELLHHFRRAEKIERLIITLETGESISSNRMLGDFLELRLDRNNNNNSFVHVSSERQDWVDASFSSINEVLGRCSNKHGWARSAWTTLIIQLLGVVGGFGVSLWAASKVSENLNIDNAFVITFLFVLLLFSNAWGYANQALLRFVHSVYPSVHFYRPDKDRINWLLQGVIAGVAATCTVYLLGGLLSYVGDFINQLA